MCTVLELLCVLFSVTALNFPFNTRCSNEQLKMSYCYLAFRTNVRLNLYCPGHLSYFSPNESEPLRTWHWSATMTQFLFGVCAVDLVCDQHGVSPVDAYEKWRSQAEAKACCDFGLQVALTWWGDQVYKDMEVLTQDKGKCSVCLSLAGGVRFTRTHRKVNFCLSVSGWSG